MNLNDENGVPAEFGSVNIAGKRVTLGVTLSREFVDFGPVDKTLCMADVNLTIRCDPQGQDDDEAQTCMTDTSVEIAATAECGGLGVKPRTIAFTLTLAYEHVDVAMLGLFSKRRGRLKATRIGDAGAGEPK